MYILMYLRTIKVFSIILSLRKLNLHHRRWLELIKDYDMSVHYHSNKANVVAVALSQFIMGSVSHIDEEKKELVNDVI